MFNFNDALFSIGIPESVQIVFVADLFVDDYVGGAELTTEALVSSSPFEVFKVKSRDVTLDLLKQGVDKFWIFGNYAELNPQLIPSIVGNLNYSILEYDYKYCRFRSPEKHHEATKIPCDCENQINGKMISAFMHGARGIWWMSESQKDHYIQKFPFLDSNRNHVLSSVFDDRTLAQLKLLRSSNLEKKGWIVLGSNSWVKGANDAIKWCQDNKKEYTVVWNKPYEELLALLAASEGFVYLPKGMDTCPRMVIEAKLLGCQLVVNDYVQHHKEEWFATDDVDSIFDYLHASKTMFWNSTRVMMEYKPTISGYLTTFNCVNQGYPFEQCIQSMLQFCDEVCVVDGGSSDDTWNRLVNLAHPDMINLSSKEQVELVEDIRTIGSSPHQTQLQPSKLKLQCIHRDWTDPRFALFDGMQKAEARKMCTSEFCWQMDSDEVVHETDAQKILDLARALPREALVIALPVVEYWGSSDKVRIDVQPWKWRLSRNDHRITHGVPGALRVMSPHPDSSLEYIAKEGTDGCDMIFADTLEPVPFVTFYSQQAEAARQAALSGHQQALEQYQQWFNSVVENVPGVFHYSWYDLKRKIRLYRNYWTKHWNSLYGKDLQDTAQTNMMFDLPWSDVTDEMIDELANKLNTQSGGWIWHRKWDGTSTPHIIVARSQPSLMKAKA